MGHSDIESLNRIYQFATQFCRLMEFPFRFREDSGNFETAIGITEDGHIERPLLGSNWKVYKNGKKLFVPDVLDYNNKIIFEYEETWKKEGKRKRKGHDPDALDRRTSTRDLYYEIAKFRVLKIFDYEFEFERAWKLKIAKFLIKCHEIPLEKKVQHMGRTS